MDVGEEEGAGRQAAAWESKQPSALEIQKCIRIQALEATAHSSLLLAHS